MEITLCLPQLSHKENEGKQEKMQTGFWCLDSYRTIKKTELVWYFSFSVLYFDIHIQCALIKSFSSYHNLVFGALLISLVTIEYSCDHWVLLLLCLIYWLLNSLPSCVVLYSSTPSLQLFKRSVYQTEYAVFIFLGLIYFVYYNILLFHSFSCVRMYHCHMIIKVGFCLFGFSTGFLYVALVDLELTL